jgi:hypothetical protein
MPPLGQPVPARALAVAALLCVTLTSADAQQAHQSVADYVRGHVFDARPGDVAALAGSAAVPELSAMLDSDEPYWLPAAGLLVALGDERAVDALIAFVPRPCPNPMFADVYENARAAAIVGLGDLAHRIGSERALTYLVESLSPDVWKKRKVRGDASWTKSFDAYEALLSEYAIYGLAYSGSARAGEALRSLQRSPTPEQARFRKGLDKTLELWLEVYDLVAERGMTGNQARQEVERRRSAELLPKD